MNSTENSILKKFEYYKQELLKISGEIIEFHKNSGSNKSSDTIQNIKHNFENDIFKILVLGEQKRGKSSLINSILGERILPEGVIPVNNTIVEILNSDKKEVQIDYFDKPSDVVEIDKLKDYCSEKFNKGNEKKVSKVFVKYPVPLLGNSIVLVDTPGENSVYTYHSELLHSYIPQASAIIFLVSADSPISNTEIKFLKDKVSENDIKKIFFIVSKIDLITDEEVQEVIEFNDNILKKQNNFNFEPSNFIPVSSKNFIEGKSSDNSYLSEKSNFHFFLSSLQRFIEGDKAKLSIDRYISGIIVFLNEIKSEFEQKSHMAKLNKSALEQKINELSVKKSDYDKIVFQTMKEFEEVIKLSQLEFSNKSFEIKQNIDTYIKELICNLTLDNIEKDAQIISMQVGEQIITELKSAVEIIRKNHINRGLEKVREKLNEIKFDFEKFITSFNYDVPDVNSAPNFTFGLGSLLAAIGIAAGATLTSTVTVSVVTSPWLYWLTLGWFGATSKIVTVLACPWLIPAGIVLGILSWLGKNKYKEYLLQEAKNKLNENIFNESTKMIDKSVTEINESFKCIYRDIYDCISSAINNDIQSVIKTMKEIKATSNENEINILITKSDDNIRYINECINKINSLRNL